MLIKKGIGNKLIFDITLKETYANLLEVSIKN